MNLHQLDNNNDQALQYSRINRKSKLEVNVYAVFEHKNCC